VKQKMRVAAVLPLLDYVNVIFETIPEAPGEIFASIPGGRSLITIPMPHESAGKFSLNGEYTLSL
jgi:hypothetical protein